MLKRKIDLGDDMAAQPTSGQARPLKVGLALPTFDASVMGRTPRWKDFKAAAQHAEGVGFDSIWVPDHMIHNAFQPNTEFGVWECWSILTAVAAITNRVELGTLVLCTGFRNPAMIAKMADTIEEVSGGRLILGLGAGYYEREYTAYGFPFDHLVGRFEESLTIISSLLRKGRIDFQGQYYQARDCELTPRGPRSAGPPIMIGAKPDRPRALRLTAQYADYWNAFGVNRAEAVAPMRHAVDGACRKAGRDPKTLQRTITTVVELPDCKRDVPATAWTKTISSMGPVTGTPDEIAQSLRAIAREGIDHVQIWLEPFSMPAIDVFARVLDRLDRD
jgi:alkanesulfonate monooxygenase SsuD/methylene tetrahydromethanopterin reductase-like flavin-dependent oxidoreductase (luciferase family)